MIKELLEQLQTKYKDKATTGTSIRELANTQDTWRKIQNGSWSDNMSFLDDSEKDSFLRDWISENPYLSIS